MKKENATKSQVELTPEKALELIKAKDPELANALEVLLNSKKGVDSMSQFFSAIGAAVLGMLATLLVLSVMSGGHPTNSTKISIQQAAIEALSANIQRINENVGAVSQNVDTVANQMGANNQYDARRMEALIDALRRVGVTLSQEDIDSILAGNDDFESISD